MISPLGWPRGDHLAPLSQGRRSGLGWPAATVTLPPSAPEGPDLLPVSRETSARSGLVTAVANQKGGVGKTTTAVNLAASLALSGSAVLLIDMDPQGNASTAVGIDHRQGTPSVYDALLDDVELAKVIQPAAGVPNLDCVISTIDLAGAEIELVPKVARELRLKRALQAIRMRYDYVFVDCPPSLGLLTVNALVAADEVLIPIQCEYYALEGLRQLLDSIELVRVHLNADLRVGSVLLTLYDARTKLAEQVAADVRQHFGEKVLRCVIPRSVRISEAPSYGQTVVTYDPASRGAQLYRSAAAEWASRAGGMTKE